MVFLRISRNSQDPQTWGLQPYQKRDSGTGVSCEFCEISKNTFSYRTPPVVASDEIKLKMYYGTCLCHLLYSILWLTVIQTTSLIMIQILVSDGVINVQPLTKNLRLTPVFMWSSALQDEFSFCSSRVFC